MILVQLINEPPVRRGGGTTRPDKFEGLRRVETMSGDEVPTHDGDGAASAHRTMDEDARIWIRAQGVCDIARREREVRGELCEWRVVQGHLHRAPDERRWQRDMSRHRR